MLAREIIVCQQAAAVRIAFQRFSVQRSVQLVHIHFHAHALHKFFEDANPGIQIRSTVITVHHRHKTAVRRRNEIDGVIYFFQLIFQNDHREYARSRGYVTGSACYGIGSRHPGSRIAFRRTERNARL